MAAILVATGGVVFWMNSISGPKGGGDRDPSEFPDVEGNGASHSSDSNPNEEEMVGTYKYPKIKPPRPLQAASVPLTGSETNRSRVAKANSRSVITRPARRKAGSGGKAGGHPIVADGSYQTRNEALLGLGNRVDPEQQGQFHSWLAESDVLPAGLRREEWHALWNDVAERSVRLGDESVIPVLEGVYQNPNSDPVLRDYAIQQLGLWLEIDSGPSGTTVRETVNGALDERSLSTAGTALLALNAVDESGTSADVSNKAAELARNGSGGPESGNQTTGLAVLADRNDPQASVIARELLSDGKVAPSVKIASIAAIGSQGDSSDVEWLKNDYGSDPRYAAAVDAAVKKLQEN